MNSRKSFVETSSITTTYDRHGNMTERVVIKNVPVTTRTLSRQKKQEAITKIQDMVQRLEIGPWFGNRIATMIKGCKKNPRWKNPKPKKVIEFGSAEAKFTHSSRTRINELKLIKNIIEKPDDFCIVDEKVIEQLKKDFAQQCFLFSTDYPMIAIRSPTIRTMLEGKERRMREWYRCANQLEWTQVEKKPIEEICKFYLNATRGIHSQIQIAS